MLAPSDYYKYFGWKDLPAEVERIMSAQPNPTFSQAAPHLRGTAKNTLLYRAVLQVAGHWRSDEQGIGDCVSHGCEKAVRQTYAAAIAAGLPFEWKGEFSTEAIYVLSRIEIGRGAIGRDDGSTGAWGAEAVKQFGVLLRQKYPGFDVSDYNSRLAKELGMPKKGLPDELEPVAKEHPVTDFTMLGNFTEVGEAMSNGKAVSFASDQGFSNKRDSKGFAATIREKWYHQMAGILCIVDGPDPGIGIDNSWPPWITGPKAFDDMPEGSFMARPEVIDRMCKVGEAIAYTSLEGWPAQAMPDYTFC